MVKYVTESWVETTVESGQYWNTSGLLLEKGSKYRIDTVKPNPKWWDAGQEATPTGWVNQPNGFIQMLTKLFARDTDQKLFQMMGVIYSECEDGWACGIQFPIRLGTEFEAKATGEFCSFANDLPFKYGNNLGSIKIKLSRVDETPLQ